MYLRRKMWQAISQIHPKLQVTQSQGIKLMVLVAEGCKEVWPRELAKQEIANFAKTMALRYRTMAKHIAGTFGSNLQALRANVRADGRDDEGDGGEQRTRQTHETSF